MTQFVDFVALGWVEKNLRGEVEAARRSLHHYQRETSEPRHLQDAERYIHCATGALRLCTLEPAAMLSEEVETVLHMLHEGSIAGDARKTAMTELVAAIEALPAYLATVRSKREVTPASIAKVVNDLRLASGRPALPDAMFFDPPLAEGMGITEGLAAPEDNAVRALAADASACWRAHAAGAIDGNHDDLAQLRWIAGRGLQLLAGTRLEPALRGLDLLLGAMLERNISVDENFDNLVGYFGYLFSQLQEKGALALDSVEPQQQVKYTLYHIGKQPQWSEAEQAFLDSFGIDDVNNYIQVSEQRMIQEDDLLDALRQTLDQLREIMVFLSSPQEAICAENTKLVEKIVPSLLQVGMQLHVIGLSELASNVNLQYKTLSHFAQRERPTPPAELVDFGGALSSIRDEIEFKLKHGLAAVGNAATLDLDGAVNDQITHCLHEMKAGINREFARQGLEEMMAAGAANLQPGVAGLRPVYRAARLIAEPELLEAMYEWEETGYPDAETVMAIAQGLLGKLSDGNYVAAAASHLEQVIAVLGMMENKERERDVLRKCSGFINGSMALGGIPRDESIQCFTEVIAALEQYLECRSADPWSKPEKHLQRAEQRASRLSSHLSQRINRSRPDGNVVEFGEKPAEKRPPVESVESWDNQASPEAEVYTFTEESAESFSEESVEFVSEQDVESVLIEETAEKTVEETPEETVIDTVAEQPVEPEAEAPAPVEQPAEVASAPAATLEAGTLPWRDALAAWNKMDIDRPAEPLPEGPDSEIDRELLECFVEEFDEYIVNLNAACEQLQAAPQDADHIKAIRVVFHTLKGSARTIDLAAFGEFMYDMERVFNALRDNYIQGSVQIAEFVTAVAARLPYIAQLIGQRIPLQTEDFSVPHAVAAAFEEKRFNDDMTVEAQIPMLEPVAEAPAEVAETSEPVLEEQVFQEPLIEAPAAVLDTAEQVVEFVEEVPEATSEAAEFVEQPMESGLDEIEFIEEPPVFEESFDATFQVSGWEAPASEQMLDFSEEASADNAADTTMEPAAVEPAALEPAIEEVAAAIEPVVEQIPYSADLWQSANSEVLVAAINAQLDALEPAPSRDEREQASQLVAAVVPGMLELRDASLIDLSVDNIGYFFVLAGMEHLASGAIYGLQQDSDGAHSRVSLSESAFGALEAYLGEMRDNLAMDHLHNCAVQLLHSALELPVVELPETSADVAQAGDNVLAFSGDNADDFLDNNADDFQVEDIDEELLDLFIETMDEYTEATDAATAALAAGDEDALRDLKNTLHTVKGAANSIGLRRFGALVHDFESRIADLEFEENKDEKALQQEIDTLVAEFNEAATFVRRNRADYDEVAMREDKAQPVEDVFDEEGVPMPVQTNLDDVVERLTTLRVETHKVDHLLDMGLEISMSNVRSRQALDRAAQDRTEIYSLARRIQTLVDQLSLQLDTEIQAKTEIMSDDQQFDPLEMDRITEKQAMAAILREAAFDLQEESREMGIHIDTAVREVQSSSRLLQSSQSDLRQMRLVAFSKLGPGLRRLAYQTSRTLGKQVEFDFNCGDGGLDVTVFEQIRTALEHMLRNSIDHGIGTPEKRAAQGKAETGRVQLTVNRRGSEFVIRLVDDGNGIDPDVLRNKAREIGLLKPNEEISDAEALQLIFKSGFSTADEVTDVSGRGVGMDVVFQSITQSGGTVDIQSKVGFFTQFEIRVPAAIMVNEALLATVGEEQIAIPLTSLRGSEYHRRDKAFEAMNSPEARVTFRDQEYEVRYLGAVRGTAPNPALETMPDFVPLLFAQLDRRRVAFIADGLDTAEDLVIRSLGAQFTGVPGIAGGAVKSDGRPVLALDLNEFIAQVDYADKHADDEVAEKDEGLLILCVDDSVMMRRTYEKRLGSLGHTVVTAVDGEDALDYLSQAPRAPDFVFSDLEMPKMNGFDFIANLRRVPEFAEIPCVVVSSRDADKHRSEAQRVGATAFMAKGSNSAEGMQAMIDRYLGTSPKALVS
ncbi:hybrid sensor histidine kinase/response regulator [Mangrovimicrobium sediminis]|uniref:Chemotaxis protein CheA n=1 Tax=Mangrovimicrobium sediminis TaxID=2562682 RepID=A0A4Z0LUY9_9GAMM|nr:Hpt domain-containing protein [Haliea sp. SAOS-164]TGD70916.1 hybrid sensor histidine kinase/response regulator [Haliea sp. SAOS-164]